MNRFPTQWLIQKQLLGVQKNTSLWNRCRWQCNLAVQKQGNHIATKELISNNPVITWPSGIWFIIRLAVGLIEDAGFWLLHQGGTLMGLLSPRSFQLNPCNLVCKNTSLHIYEGEPYLSVPRLNAEAQCSLINVQELIPDTLCLCLWLHMKTTMIRIVCLSIYNTKVS